jgi:hypothetical protein
VPQPAKTLLATNNKVTIFELFMRLLFIIK